MAATEGAAERQCSLVDFAGCDLAAHTEDHAQDTHTLTLTLITAVVRHGLDRSYTALRVRSVKRKIACSPRYA